MRMKFFQLSGLQAAITVSIVVMLLTLLSGRAPAQQGGQPAALPLHESVAAPADSTTPRLDNGYVVGAGDLLEIRVLNYPQFSREAVRVETRGTILMPKIDGEIQAACHTTAELGQLIATSYMKYIRRPQVAVYVKESQAQPVAMIGAVNAPGRFQLQRPVRLLELLAFASGPSDRAGQTVQILHVAEPSICNSPSQTEDGHELSLLVAYRLYETLRGVEKANPYVRSGDIITVPEAEQIFVVGNVRNPGPLSLKVPLTVSRALMMSGGKLPDTKSGRVRIIRQPIGSPTPTEFYVDLKAIEKKQAEDIALQANDIVDVPKASGGTQALKGILRTFIPAVSQLPLRVIY